MIPLADPRWKAFTNAFKVPYDASVALARLEQGEDAWDELWEELHHQGGVGTASYAAVPHLVRIASEQRAQSWQPYALVSVIDIERRRKWNPEIPAGLLVAYERAIREMGALALSELEGAQDELFVRSALGAIALSKGLVKLGTLLALSDTSDLDEYLEEKFSWSELYA